MFWDGDVTLLTFGWFKNFFLEVKKSYYLRARFPNASELRSTHVPLRADGKGASKRWYSTGEGEVDPKMLGLATLSMAVPLSEYILSRSWYWSKMLKVEVDGNTHLNYNGTKKYQAP